MERGHTSLPNELNRCHNVILAGCSLIVQPIDNSGSEATVVPLGFLQDSARRIGTIGKI